MLTELLKQGAQRMLAVAIQAEVDEWIENRKLFTDESGCRQVVRNGYLPERKITTGVEEIKVRQPRVRDRRDVAEREKFSSKILPHYLRKTKKQCILVLIGTTKEGKKELISIQDGYRESEQSWKSLLLEVKARGLTTDPKLAIGDGALGFWKALPKVFPTTRSQRCWVHKTVNVLDKMPKRLQEEAKQKLHEIWMADTREHANQAFDLFIATYEQKYSKAVECLQKDRNELLAFYDFPAEHWSHIRTTNPIESTFATVRLRTKRTKGCGSRMATLTMVFKLIESAQKSWRRLNGYQKLQDISNGIPYKDGVRVHPTSDNPKPETPNPTAPTVAA